MTADTEYMTSDSGEALGTNVGDLDMGDIDGEGVDITSSSTPSVSQDAAKHASV